MAAWGTEGNLLAWGRLMKIFLNTPNEDVDDMYGGGRRRPANWEDMVAKTKGKMAEQSK